MRKKMKEKKGNNWILLFFMFGGLIISVFMGVQSRKNIGDGRENEMHIIQEEEEIHEQKEILEKKESEKRFITRPKISVGEIVALILEKGDGEIDYKLIEVEGRDINISGEATEIDEIYRLEKELRSEGARKINSDYIKIEGEKVQFKMDFSLEHYGKDKLEPYIPAQRRIFMTPTEQRVYISRLISRRCEIISIGRSQKQEFSEEIMETAIPYHTKGDLNNIVNLFLEIEDSRIFLSLMEDPVKILITEEMAEVYFKVTGYSGSFS